MPINNAATMPVTTKPAQRPMPSSASQKYKYTWVKRASNNTSHVASPAPHVLSYPSLPVLHFWDHTARQVSQVLIAFARRALRWLGLCDGKGEVQSDKTAPSLVLTKEQRQGSYLLEALRQYCFDALRDLSPTLPLCEMYDLDVSLLYTDIVPWACESIQVDVAGGTICDHATLHM
jgi:hypothetical protein